MILNVQQVQSEHKSQLQKLQKLLQQHNELAIERQADFLQNTYFSELVTSFYQTSILQFELRLPLGNESHKKAYFIAKFEEMNHFF